MKKPNTKNVLMILISVLLVGGAFIVAEYRNKQAALIYDNLSVATTTKSNYIEETSDWKKILLATDKTGTSTIKDLTKNTQELSQTDQIARDFFAQYMKLKQIGISGDKASQADLVSQTANKINLQKPKDYTMDEIIIINNNSNDMVKNYGNTIANIFNKYTTDGRDEGVITKDAIQKNDPNILKELDPIIDSYKKILNALLAVPAPKLISDDHLMMVNAMNSLLFADQSYRKSAIDPISGIQGVSQSIPAVQKLIGSLKNIRSYMQGKAIIYKENEAGFAIFTFTDNTN